MQRSFAGVRGVPAQTSFQQPPKAAWWKGKIINATYIVIEYYLIEWRNIMPALVVEVPIKDTFVDSSNPTTNYGGYYALLLGNYLGSVVYRSLLQFDSSTLPSGYIITKAELALYIIRNDNPGTAKVYDIFRIRQSFDENTVNYSNQPSIDPVSLASITINNELNSFVKVDITDLVKEWYEGKFVNYGLEMRAADETLSTLVAFDSKECGNEVFFPQLEISLEEPVQISGQRFVEASETGLTTADSFNFSQAYDVSQNVNYTFFVKNTGGLNNANAIIQISPDAVGWTNDSALYIITPGQIASIIPKTFSKYTRLAYKSASNENSTTIDINIQAQI